MTDAPGPVATHEAGHAVVALVQGLWFHDVVMPGTLSADRSTGNLHGGIETVQADPNWTLDAELRVAVAGPLAERRVAVADDYDERYEAHVAVFRPLLRFEGVDPGSSILDAAADVDRLLDEPAVWAAVVAVAARLEILGRLEALGVSEMVVREVGAGTYPIRSEPPTPGFEVRGVFDS